MIKIEYSYNIFFFFGIYYPSAQETIKEDDLALSAFLLYP